jgi:hypothetical protein
VVLNPNRRLKVVRIFHHDLSHVPGLESRLCKRRGADSFSSGAEEDESIANATDVAVAECFIQRCSLGRSTGDYVAALDAHARARPSWRGAFHD